MKLRLNANAIITNNEGKILLIQLKNGPFTGGYCIPGGGVEAGERGKDAVKREIYEETGIVVKDVTPLGFCELFHQETKSHRVVTLWQGRGEGTPVQKEEHLPLWMNMEEAYEKSIPMTRKAINLWKNEEKHFCHDE